MAAAAGKRAFAGGGPRIGETGKFEGEFKVQKSAPYINHRLQVWEKLYKQYSAGLASKPRKDIKIELPDGTVKDGKAFETSPMDIAMSISKGLAESAVVAKVIYKETVESLKQCVVADIEEDEPEEQNDPAEQSVLWDMTRPLEGSCRMELLKFDHPQGQDVFWHSSAHILGDALEGDGLATLLPVTGYDPFRLYYDVPVWGGWRELRDPLTQRRYWNNVNSMLMTWSLVELLRLNGLEEFLLLGDWQLFSVVPEKMEEGLRTLERLESISLFDTCAACACC
eukprot:symbB.v1.2.018656.t1/scaffold1498.1/size115254/2